MTKQCTICKEVKPLDTFHKASANKTDGRSGRCKICAKVYNKAWQAANPEKAKESWRRAEAKSRNDLRRRATKYGLTKTELQDMLVTADGRCEICGKQTERLAVDHCHKSSKVRGLLCLQCNTALGNFNDNVEIMLKAINYIKFHMGV